MKGLYVQNGTLFHEGRPFYKMGVNFYNLFNSSFPKEEGEPFDTSTAFQGLQELAENNIPYVRANLGGYYWYELKWYFEHKEEYKKTFLSIAKEAERLHIGIIPSFYWLIQCVNDYYHEPMRSWGNKDSKARAFMREYTTEMVELLKDCESIWGWEFGNEFNLGADLPNAADNRPPLFNGSPRPASDCITLDDIHDAFEEFSEIVYRLDDDKRMITSGNATLRNAQYRIHQKGIWEQDTEEEHKKATALYHPGKMNVVSEHIYFRKDFYFDRELTLDEYLCYTMQMCRELGKPLLVGEFGHNNLTEPEPTEEKREEAYDFMASQMVSHRVQASLLWNYDPLGGIEYSFTGTSRKGKFLFALINRCNEQYNR